MELDWDAVGAIAELIGGVGVIATLFYFGIADTAQYASHLC